MNEDERLEIVRRELAPEFLTAENVSKLLQMERIDAFEWLLTLRVREKALMTFGVLNGNQWVALDYEEEEFLNLLLEKKPFKSDPLGKNRTDWENVLVVFALK